MADYYQHWLVQQTIPDCDMTPIERLLLSHIFECERQDDGWFFFAEEWPSTMISATRAELETALAASETDCAARACVVDELAWAAPDAASIDVDVSQTSWEFIFRDIVRRSSTLRYISVVAAFTCSKMRRDGFGGMATVITADTIARKSTNDLIEDFLADARRGKTDAGFDPCRTTEGQDHSRASGAGGAA